MNSVPAFAGRHGSLLLLFGVLIGFVFPALAAAARPWMGASVFEFTLGAFLKVDGNAFRAELRRPLRAAAAVLAWTLVGAAGRVTRTAAPTAMATSPTMLTRCGPWRLTNRPAGRPVSAAATWPDDMTSPPRAASRANAPER